MSNYQQRIGILSLVMWSSQGSVWSKANEPALLETFVLREASAFKHNYIQLEALYLLHGWQTEQQQQRLFPVSLCMIHINTVNCSFIEHFFCIARRLKRRTECTVWPLFNLAIYTKALYLVFRSYVVFIHINYIYIYIYIERESYTSLFCCSI